MKFFILSALVAVVALTPLGNKSSIFSDSFSGPNSSCYDKNVTVHGESVIESHCLVTATWKLRINDVCNVSTYFKETIFTSADKNPANGVAQCTKTPCDVTEKITVDCKEAFGEKLSKIEN